MKHAFFNLSFTYRLVWLSALVSGLVWLVFGGVLFYVAKHSLEEQLAEYQAVTAKGLMQTIDRSLFTAHQGIQMIAQDSRLIRLLSGDRKDFGAELEDHISEHLERQSLLTGPWRVVTLFDASGDIVVSNMPDALGSSLLDHPEAQAAFQAGLENRIYHSNLALLGENSSPSLIFAAPVHRHGLEETEVAGVIVGEYGWPVVTQSLDGVARATTVQLLRNDGTIIASRSAESRRVGIQAPEWRALQAANFSGGKVVLNDFLEPGKESTLLVASRQAGHLRYGGHDWLLTLETPKSVLLAPVYTLAWQLALAAFVGVLALCAVLFATGIYLTKPIGAMSRAVKAFSRGNTSVRIALNDRESKDEIAELARNFNNMAEDIGHFISEQLRREEEARHRAHHDDLTGLPNRSLFQDRITHAIKAAERDRVGFAVCFIDLDGFKPVNDVYGHRTGDLLLEEIARRLLARCRDSDTVARYGGDEFVVLLRNTNEVAAVALVADALLAEIARPVVIDEIGHQVRASLGIALYPDHALDALALLRKADAAMYSAKDAGKGCYRLFEEFAEG